MISKEQFLELKHLKSLGVPTTTICKKIGISVPSANKWLRLDEDAFDQYLRNNTPYLEQYRAFILSILKICPQTPATNIMYRIKDQFPDFSCKKTTFFRYVKDLREQTGYVRPDNRPTSFREETPPGYEAQVDFGQFKMKGMYDRNLWVYFFCMVLSYSRMRFVYFSREPFRTKTAIEAHKYAFRYFGGRTQTILYDQDKVFVVSENYGNIILVPEFEDFVRQAGFSVILCHKSDPQTKGKVESFVRYVKEGFLQGRLYAGIDSLNSAALEWLDKECNGTTHERTRKAPRELFREESKHLEKVQFEDTEVAIRAVSDKYAVVYTCANGKTITFDGVKKNRSQSGFEMETSVYSCKDCDGCPLKEKCIRACGSKKPLAERSKVIYVSKRFARQRAEMEKRINTTEGKLIRVNRSIQAEGVFAMVKEDMGFRRFLLRSAVKVEVEWTLLSLAYNVLKLHHKIQTGRLGTGLVVPKGFPAGL